MEYKIEEMEITLDWFGSNIDCLIDCDIEISDWDYEPGESGGYFDGGRLPEPSYPESYTATNFDLVGDVRILMDFPKEEVELTISANSIELKDLLILSMVYTTLRGLIDWTEVNNLLTEEITNRG